MSVKCPFCHERVNFSYDGICPECDGELNESQLNSMNKAIQKGQQSQLITCKMCGEKNNPTEEECVSCGEPVEGSTSLRHRTEAIWSHGKLLVMDRDAILPNICIKSNEPAEGNYLKQKLTCLPKWSVPIVIIVLLLTLLGGAILALVLQKKATIEVGISKKWQLRRKKRLWIKWGTAAFGLLLIPVGILVLDFTEGDTAETIAVILFSMSGLMLFGGMMLAALDNYGIVAKKITDEYIYIKGAHQDYVNRFPVWEGE